MKRRLFSPPVIGLAIALAIFGVCRAARRFGVLEPWELGIYDKLVAARRDPGARDPRIVLIGINENDIRQRDYPLRDTDLAALLKTVLAGEPAGVGLDLYRDRPEPRSGEGLPALESVLRRADNVVCIFKPRTGEDDTGVPPPPALDQLPAEERVDRVVVNDIPSDGAVARRAYLLIGADGQNYFSVALRLALFEAAYEAERRGVPPPEFSVAEDASAISFGRGRFHRFRTGEGGYHRVRNQQDGGFQFLADFKSPPARGFTSYSLGDVLGGKLPPDAFRGKVVLIGTMANSIKDEVSTPFDPLLPGFVWHAQTINQILRSAFDGDRPTRGCSGRVGWAWALFWALLGAGCGLGLLRCPIRAALALALGAAGLWAAPSFALQHGWWLTVVEPALNYSVCAAATLGLVYSWERRQRAELMQLFSRHVSEDVAAAIWAQRDTFLDGSRPRPQKLSATVLFTDFVGFSTVSEKFDAQTLMDWLNEAMDHLARKVDANDGFVNKYIGDAVMAVFGAPIPRETEAEIARDARNAVRCSLAMGMELDLLNSRWRAEGRPEISMRIGIYSGVLVAGSLGSADRLEFTVIGDTVNTASRLESTKKDEILPPPGSVCRILIGESTRNLIGDQFEVEYVGDETLKGKDNKVGVYRVVREFPVIEKPTQALALTV